MNRFNLKHPQITPEKYILNKLDKRINYLKGLYIPSDPVETVKIIYSEPKDAIQEYISIDNKIDVVPLHSHYHMYLDLMYYIDLNSINVIATKLYRMCFANNIGRTTSETIHGPVLIYGTTINSVTSKYEDCSVPYEVVEQCFRLYENYCYEL